MAVAHAVKTRQVGRALGRCDHIVGRDRQAGVRQTHLHDLGPEPLQLVDRGLHRGADPGIQPLAHEFPDDADADATDVLAQRRRIIIDRTLRAGRITLVEARHPGQHQRRVLGAAGHRTGLIERRGEGDHPPARATTIGRLDPGDTGQSSRLADRTTGIGAGRRDAQACRHRRSRAAGGAAGHGFTIPGITHRTEITGLVRRAHRELVHVGLAKHDHPCALQVLDHGRVIRRDEIFQHPRTTAGAYITGAKDVLVRDRDTGQRARRAAGYPCVGRRGLFQSQLLGHGDETVEHRVMCFDALQHMRRELGAGHLATVQPGAQLGDGLFMQFHKSA